jgi:hypothetical protein
MKILVSLEPEEGDLLDALYLLHFVNGVRVDLDARNPHAVLDMSYFEGRYVAPAGDVHHAGYHAFTAQAMGQAPPGGIESEETGLTGA